MQVQGFTMSIYSNKEKMEGNDYKDICRNHTAKTDREMYRVCPSKLSKRELEDLYFTLLENNMELKKTVNGQNDKIRLLSTQVQRMTSMQEKLVSKDMKDRGTATKAVVDGQKDFISELKDTNKRLSDRIQQLNMKLCSTKQFLKTSPPQTAPSRSNRSAATASSTPKKYECVKKTPESLPEQVLKVSTYSQWEDKKLLKSDRPCDENKCRTLMEELKMKIATLQDELVNVHGEYATRIGRLENEVVEVRKENIRVVSERSASEIELADSNKKANDLLAQYRSFEAQCSELTTELAIERQKVAELQTQLKAANMSDKVNKTIEDHLTTKQETSGAPDGRPQDGGRLEGFPEDGSPPDSGPKNGIPQDGGSLDVTPRAGFTHDGNSRDGRPQDGGSRDGVSRDDGTRDGGSEDGSIRDNGSRKCNCGCAPTPPIPPTPPRVVNDKARDIGLRDGIRQDGGPLDVSPRAGFPRDGDPRDDNFRDGVPRIFSPRAGGPRDGTPRDAGPKNFIFLDVSPLDITPQVSFPRDGGPQDGGPPIFSHRDDGPRDNGTRDRGTQDSVSRNASPEDGRPRGDGSWKSHCGCPPTPPITTTPPRVVNDKARDISLRDGILQDGGPLDVSPRAGFPRDGGPRDDNFRDGVPRIFSPRAGGPRDGTPRDVGPKNGILQDVSPLDITPQAIFPRDRGPQDGVPRIFSPLAGGPRDGTSRDAGPKNGILQDVSPLDITPQASFPRNGGPQDGGPRDDGTRDRGTQEKVSRNGSPQDGRPRDGGALKCHCGCPPTPPITPNPPRVVNKKAPIKKLHPMVAPKKRDGLDNNSGKCSTKYSMVSSASKYSSSYQTTTTSDDTNCERCGCKFQLMSAVPIPTTPVQPVHYPPPGVLKECECKPCTCPPPYHLTPRLKNGKCAMCGYHPPEVTSTPIKDKKKDVDCRCPAWMQDDLLKLSLSQETNAKCMKCCFKDELKSTASPPSKTDEGLPPTGGPSCFKGNLNTSRTADDSGYQDTEEQGLFKQNKELMAIILDLQRQIDVMNIGQVCGLPGRKPSKPGEHPRSPARTTDYSVAPSVPPFLEELTKPSEVLPEARQAKYDSPDTEDTASMNSSPSLRKFPQVEIPIEQAIEDECYPAISIPSEDHVIQPRKILHIEVLGNPKHTKASILKQTSEDMQATTIEDMDDLQAMTVEDTDDTRAKTIEEPDGTLQISDEPIPIPDKYGYPNLPYRERNRWDSPKFEIVEKKKLEIAGISKPNPDKISLKSANSSAGPGPGFNPEKFKYLEAEGLTATPETEVSQGSLTESIPSNPELGFGIPRLASKASQPDKNKAGVDFKTKNSLSTSNQMNETRLAHHPTQTDDTKEREDCQFCAACSYDKECADAINPKMNNLTLGLQNDAKKHECTNSLQIPGPIPPLDTKKKEKKRNLFSHFKKHRKENQSKEDMITDPITYARKRCDTSDVPHLEKREHTTTDAVEIQLTHDKSSKQKRGSQTKEELIFNPRLHAQLTSSTTGKPVHLADVAMLENREDDTEQKPPEESRQASRDSDAAWQGDLSWYRRRSGTYFYRTAPLSQGPFACRCVGRQGGACPKKPMNNDNQVLNDQVNTIPKEKRRAGPASDRGTYTLGSKLTDTSPDNTDLDYLSDLPSEKEKKSPLKSRPLSPGENRTTTYTSTPSSHSPTYNYSLSEGEMPANTSRPRSHSEPDIDRPYLNPTLAHKLETPHAQQMEAALQAITEELQRCKHLLQQQRPSEKPTRSTCSVQTSATVKSNPIVLKPALAQQDIGDTQAPVSVFTLHIGTVVLSDEAVLNSRDKDLVLKWKFYDQAVNMSRKRAGRVMLFDFSTEYEIKITEDFLNYLKYEQMPIVICERGREDQSFAYSALPLRDALLHTNTRADMSIALMAGPQLKDRIHGMADSLDGREEVGVIDLWCMLRADAIMVPGINLAIAQPGSPLTQEERHSGVMPQAKDDCNELELPMGRSGPAATHEQTGKNQTYSDVGYNRPSDTWSKPQPVKPPKGSIASQATSVSIGTARDATFDPSRYPPLRDRARTSTLSNSTSVQTGSRYTPKKAEVSEIIINEMISGRLNESKTSKVGGASEADVLSEARSSYGSIKSVLSRIQKRGSRNTQTHGGDQRSFIEKLRRASRTGGRAMIPSSMDGASDKYDKIANSIGQLIKTEQSKKVTIQSNCFEPEEKPERDVADGERTVSENQKRTTPQLVITVLWLALNEECEAMMDPKVQRIYVAYTFLGRSGAELETPVSLPKPKHYVEKCYFNFKKVFELQDADFPKIGHMARCRARNKMKGNAKDCIIFSIVSEPSEDPLGIESCEDIGYTFLYLGDLLAYSAGSPGYTEVIPVRAARDAATVTGVLAVRMDGLDVVRRCLLLTSTEKTSRSHPT